MAEDDDDRSGDSLRVPPHNYEVERSLLGAIFMNNTAFDQVSDFLKPHHFADPVNGMVFEACQDLRAEGKSVNPVTLKTYMQGSALIAEAGGIKYLASLAGAAVTVLNSKDYGRIIYDCAMRREIIAAGTAMVDVAYAAPMDVNVAEMLKDVEAEILKLTGTLDPTGGLKTFAQVMDATIAQWDRENKGGMGVPTGFEAVDKLLGGLHSTDLLVLAGRPSMGKTALACNIAFNVAQFYKDTQDLEHRGKQVAFFSLEMSNEQLGGRIITGKTRIISPRNRWGQEMDQFEFEKAMMAAQEHGALPFLVDDTPDQTISRMRSRLVRIHRRKRIGLVVIDYIQLMSGDKKAQDRNRVEEVSQITRGLKKMAKEMGCTVLALSQLSRAVESRDNKRPQLSDLRESGSIEQDADIVIFPYRPEYYLNQEINQTQKVEESTEKYANRISMAHESLSKSAGICEIIVAKQRHGPIGNVSIRFDKGRTWFENIEDDRGPPIQQGDLLT